MQPAKTAEQIQAMREGGKILAQLLEDLKQQVKPGVSEKELDAWVDREIKARGAIATYKTDEVNFQQLFVSQPMNKLCTVFQATMSCKKAMW